MKPLFILLSILLLTACTVTKRHFGTGYHVEWKKSHPKEEKGWDKPNIIEDELSTIAINHEVISENGFPDSVKENEVNPPEIPVDLLEKQTTVSGTHPERESGSTIYLDKVADDEVPIEPEERKVEPFTWVALGCFGLGGILGLLSIVVSIPEIALALTLVCVVTFVIFSIISVVHIHRNPSAYKAKWLSWTLFGLSSGIIGLTLYGMIYSTLTRFF